MNRQDLINPVVAAAVFLGGCSARNNEKQSVQNATSPTPIEALEPVSRIRQENQAELGLLDEQLISDENFTRLTIALENSDSPLLTTLGQGLVSDYDARTNADYYPSWLKESYSPLVITYREQDPFSMAIFSGTNSNENNSFSVIAPNGQHIYESAPVLEKVSLHLQLSAISMGLAPDTVTSLYLAKEYLTGHMNLAMGRGMYNFMIRQGYSIDSRLTDPESLEIVGNTVFMNEISMSGTAFNQAADLASAFMIALEVDGLVSQGIVAQNDHGMGTFMAARRVLEEFPEWRSLLTSYSEKIEADQLPDSEDTFDVVLHPQAAQTANLLFRYMNRAS